MPPPSDARTLTPSELNRQARGLLESHFDFVWVEGEISNFARPSSGHWYFTLKDDNAQVRCAMFRNRNQRLRFTPENGDLVRLRARVSLYEGRGEFQLIGEFLEAAGAGALQARFEALRDRLRAEGLFDVERKQALPTAAEHLAVITSPTGAALQDVLQVLERRNPAIRVTVLPVPVQGDDAPAALTSAVYRANTLAKAGGAWDFQAIMLVRGGGSLEDLWAFNDENLARAIVHSDLPVVTGVGHEVDFTIADFAADARAPTPSAAAEMLSQDREAERLVLQRLQRNLQNLLSTRLERHSLGLKALGARLRHPGERLREQAQRLDRLELDLQRGLRERLGRFGLGLQHRSEQLAAAAPRGRLLRSQEQLSQYSQSLHVAAARSLSERQTKLASLGHRLADLSPLAILDRGYAVLTDEDGVVVRRAAGLEPGQQLRGRVAEGEVSLRVD